MGQPKISKIRDLVDKHPDDDSIVLNDLLKQIVAIQKPLCRLEVSNYKEDIKSAIKMTLELERSVVALKYRLRSEVKLEVLAYHKMKPKKKGHSHPNSLKNLNYLKNRE